MNVEVKRIRTAAETALLEAFIAAESELPGTAQIHAARRARMALFEREGLPHRRVEQWKYTDLRALVRQLAPLSARTGDLVVHAPLISGSTQIVMVDGAMVPIPSQNVDGVSIGSLRHELLSGSVSLEGPASPDRAIDALNAAFFHDGVRVSLADDVKLTAPIEIVFIRSAADSMSHARAYVDVGAGASTDVIERHISPDGTACQSTSVTHYTTGQGAELAILRVQEEGDSAVHLGEVSIQIGAQAKVRLLHLCSGAALSRIETRTAFRAQEARFDVAGITMLAARQHNDLTLYVYHLVPNCVSSETFKSVIDDHATGVFQGKIIVARDAQKSDAQMAINALLLSETADMAAKPELEIFADDVTCAHGATCGEIDEDLMFYLLARGIPTQEARKLLLHAFLAEGAALYDGHPFQELAFGAVDTWLSAHAVRAE